jgi:hypothetical protein
MIGNDKSRHRAATATPRKRTYNAQLIKLTWPYTVQEVADLFGIQTHAVLNWLAEGLHADRTTRPFLIRGTDLARFLRDRQARRRQQCAADEFYCFKCRAPRQAFLGIADIVIESPTRLRLKALCATCETNVNKVQSIADLPAIEERFNIQELTGEHLLVRAEPSLNRDLET